MPIRELLRSPVDATRTVRGDVPARFIWGTSSNEQCRESCGLDRVWLVVAGSPPHKPGGRTAVGHRLVMARIAIAGHPAFAVSDIEATHPGPHYSVETLESIRRDHPGDELFFLIAPTSLADLPSWREPERIAQLATIVVVNRPGLEEVNPARLPDFGPGRTHWSRSRSHRWASPPATSAAAWPKAGASATWSPAVSRPTSRPTACIGAARARSGIRSVNLIPANAVEIPAKRPDSLDRP